MAQSLSRLALAAPDGLTGRDLLVAEAIPLVEFVARRMAARLPGHVELDDLINSGMLGLIDAASKFEPGRNVKFKTYAEQRITGAILDSLRGLDWVPRSLRHKKKDIETAQRSLEQQFGRAATDEEVAAHLGLALKDLQQALDDLKGATVSSFMDVGECRDGEDFITSVPDPNGASAHLLFQDGEAADVLRAAVEKLPSKERFIVQLYYFEELTMKEIGTLLGITESRVSQLHANAMERLRGVLPRCA